MEFEPNASPKLKLSQLLKKVAHDYLNVGEKIGAISLIRGTRI